MSSLDRIGPHVQQYGVLNANQKQSLAQWLQVAPTVLAIDDPSVLRMANSGAYKLFRHVWPGDRPPDEPLAEVKGLIDAIGGFNDARTYLLVCGNEQNSDDRLDRWRDVAAYAHERGYKVAGPNRATGTYEDDFVDRFRNYRLNGAPFCGFDATAWHAYWADKGFTPWNALRPLRQWRVGDPMLFVTETGRDRVRDGDPSVNDGWTGQPGWHLCGITPARYISELAEYNAELKKGPFYAVLYGVAATKDWQAFEVDSLLPQLVQMAGAPALPVPPTGGSTVKYNVGQGILDAMRVHNDEPMSDEIWYADDFSSVLGRYRRYWWYKTGGVVVSAPKAQ